MCCRSFKPRAITISRSFTLYSFARRDECNITKTLAQLDFDDGHYSIPIMLLRILIWYRKHANCPLHFYGLVRSRMKTFDNTAKFLEARVNTFTRSNKPVTDPSEDSYVANALRLALFWV